MQDFSFGKTETFIFSSLNNIFKQPFDLVHVDVWGPLSVVSHEGFRYFLTLVDDCTCVTWIYLNYVETQYANKLKAIRSDNAPKLSFTSLL